MIISANSSLLEHIARWTRNALVPLLAIALAACSANEAPEQDGALAAVAGVLAYTGRTQLSPEATIEVELLDVSSADDAEVISTQRIRNPGQLPVHFRLEYAPERIDATHRYTVQARIRDGGRIVFATDTAYPVITAGNPRAVQIEMIGIGTAVAETETREPPLEGALATPGVTATYSARFEDGKVISIQEERDSGDAGKAGAEYQFKEGRLLRYVELGRRSGPAGPMQVELDFSFDDTGELLAARKTVDDSGVRPEEAEIAAVRNRAELLRNHALALRASREHVR